MVDNIPSGFYNVTSPHLCGIIFDGTEPCGYVTQTCDTLHINPGEVTRMRRLLTAVYRKTGLVLWDFHKQNFGVWKSNVVLLDLEPVSKYHPKINTRDALYNTQLKLLQQDL